MSWYLAVLKKYAVFSGRARRKEYWMFALFYTIFYVVLDLIYSYFLQDTDFAIIGSVLILLYSLAMIIPILAVAVRRLHDVGKSGWWIFILAVPLIGSIWFFVLTVTDSQPGENQYGLNPKEYGMLA